TLTSQGLGEGSGRSGRRLRKAERPVISVVPSAPFYLQRAGTAHGIVKQLERDGFPDAQIVEGRAVVDVSAMKVNLAIVVHADEPVALTHKQLHDSAGRHRPARTDRTRPGVSFG